MKNINPRIIVLLITAGLLLPACGAQQIASPPKQTEPSHVTAIEGSDVARVELSQEAAKRLDIQTAPLSEEQVTRKRIVGGQVVLPGDGAASGTEANPGAGAVWVRVDLSAPDMNKVDRSQPVQVQPLEGQSAGMQAQLVEMPNGTGGGPAALHYEINSANHGLAPGQRVRVELILGGARAQRKIVSYAAVIYDVHGDAWVYTSPESLAFVREQITVDYIEGDRAVLLDGPPAGTAIVTVGAAELLGTELGVGH